MLLDGGSTMNRDGETIPEIRREGIYWVVSAGVVTGEPVWPSGKALGW